MKEGGWGNAVLWQRGVNLILHSRSEYLIDMEVLETGRGKWRFMGVYREPQSEMKYLTWELLEMLHSQST